MPTINILSLIRVSLKKLIEIGVIIIFLLISVFIAAIVGLPIFILRIFVSCLGYFRSDLYKIIDGLSATFAVDDIYENPRATIINSNIYNSDINIEELQRQIVQKVTDVRKSDGEIKNVRLKQYPYQWMGFMFWRWEDNFDISQHIYNYKVPGISEGSNVPINRLTEIESDLLVKPFHKNKSPWEILVVKNVESGSHEIQSMTIFRFHHSICDGLSIVKNFAIPLSSTGERKVDQFTAIKTKPLKEPGVYRFLKFVKMFMLLPFQTTKIYMEQIQENNSWKGDAKKLSNEYFCFQSEPISMSLLKEIKETHNVGITAVIYSAFAAGIREAILKRDIKISKNILCNLPFPMPGHPDFLTNHFSTACVRLPIGEADPVTRLDSIQKNLDSLKNSLVPSVPFYFSFVVGALFPVLTRLITNNVMPTAVGTSFPGPKHKYSLLGYEAVDIHFSIGPCFSHAPVILTTLSYCDGLRMKLSVNKSVLGSQLEVEHMQNTIEKEFMRLRNLKSAALKDF